jgi:hypothetical protein
MARIQIITIFINFLFILYVSSLIIKGKLREEYSIVWIICTILLTIFSFWRDGLDIITKILGIYEPPNLVFTASIFVIFIYLLHVSVVNSRLQNNITKLTQEIAILKEKVESKEHHEE